MRNSLGLKFPYTSTSCILFSLNSCGDYMKRLSENILIISAIPYYPPNVALKAITFENLLMISVGAAS